MRRLVRGELDLQVGNGARVAAMAVVTYNLSVPSGMQLDLIECFYVSCLTRNIVSVSCVDLYSI